MSKTAQFLLTILVIITILVNTTAFAMGSGPLFIFGRLLLMPLVVVLTFMILMRSQKRAQRRRFPGDVQTRKRDAGNGGAD